jgi:hypothetical protein
MAPMDDQWRMKRLLGTALRILGGDVLVPYELHLIRPQAYWSLRTPSRSGLELKACKNTIRDAVKDLCPRYSVLTPIVGIVPPPVPSADHSCKASIFTPPDPVRGEGVPVTPYMSEERLWKGCRSLKPGEGRSL